MFLQRKEGAGPKPSQRPVLPASSQHEARYQLAGRDCRAAHAKAERSEFRREDLRQSGVPPASSIARHIPEKIIAAAKGTSCSERPAKECWSACPRA